jgi:cyclic pyranopterin phosphate synthase
MPEEGIKLLRHEDILSFDEITDFTEAAVISGITKVRITGGEPLVRKGIVNLVKKIAAIEGIKDLSMTTNGVLLKEFASDLKSAGLHRVNISLDTLDPVKYSFITRGGDVTDVFAGIEAARMAGLLPIKINCVVKESKKEADAISVTDYCRINKLLIRYIRQMDLVSGHFTTVEGGTGGNCSLCNRLRLTATGKLKPCLFSDIEFDIREIGYEEAINKAIDLKPACGTNNLTGEFFNIGG